VERYFGLHFGRAANRNATHRSRCTESLPRERVLRSGHHERDLRYHGVGTSAEAAPRGNRRQLSLRPQARSPPTAAALSSCSVHHPPDPNGEGRPPLLLKIPGFSVNGKDANDSPGRNWTTVGFWTTKFTDFVRVNKWQARKQNVFYMRRYKKSTRLSISETFPVRIASIRLKVIPTPSLRYYI